MRVRYYSSFDRAYRHLRPLERGKIDHALRDLLDFFAQGGMTPPKGLGLKKLRGAFWEIRVDLRLRIVFALETDLVSLLMVGNHNDVARFLSRPD